jgi:O-antigen/teichoic acid export membrane protein
VHQALAYGLVLGAGPLLAMLLTLRPALRRSRPGPPMPWGELLEHMGLMAGSSVLAQLVVNAPVLVIGLLDTSSDLTFAVLTAGVLCRVPLFVFGSLQPTLMTGLSAAATAGDRPGFQRMLLRTCAVIAALGVAGGVPSVLLGRWLTHTFMNSPDVLRSLDYFWFAAGTMAYMLALVLGQALAAMGLHRLQLLGWTVGTAVLVAVSFVPASAATRAELGWFAGSTATAAVLLLLVRRPVLPAAAAEPAAHRLPPDAAHPIRQETHRSL